jgi:hypothetical protein
MARFKIFDEAGEHINTIIAELEFVEAAYPGRFELMPEPEPPAPAGPSAHDIDAERDRRIAAGFTFGGVFYQSRPEDRENIMGAGTAALGAMMLGAQAGDYRWHGGDSDFVWIAADNSTHPMDAQTVYAFGLAAMAHKTAHIFAARAIKDADPIPADYTDNSYWP